MIGCFSPHSGSTFSAGTSSHGTVGFLGFAPFLPPPSSSAGGFTDGLSGGTWALCGFRPVSSSNCIVVAAARERVRTDRPERTGQSALTELA